MSWPGIVARALVVVGLVLVAIDFWQWKTKRGPYRWRQ